MTVWRKCLSLGARYLSTSAESSRGLIQYSRTTDKSYIRIRGPDSPKFLNGLLTSKIVPFFTKKNLTTINPDQGQDPNANTVPQFDETGRNWGIYNELSYNGSYISRFGQYSGILNSKGKLVTDTIVYPVPLTCLTQRSERYPEYLLEFDTSIVDHILNLFQIHKLTSKVRIMKTEDLISWDLSIRLPSESQNPWIANLLDPSTMTKTPEEALFFAKSVGSALFNGNESSVVALYIERRTDEILETHGSAAQCFRVVTDSDVPDISQILNPVGLPFSFTVEKKEPSYFRKLRFEAGYVDSARDFKPETLLPLELNFDYLPNAVSADKGCYVGQELTARTFATGILRKRLVPVTLTNSNELSLLSDDKRYPEILIDSKHDNNSLASVSTPFGATPSKPRRSRPAGSLIAYEGDKGVALLRIEHFKKAFEGDQEEKLFHVKVDGKIVEINPRKPFWLEGN
ncbi:hypothetical protein HG536_0F00680 [Torulaspora globosa]|uniref:CAF17 C-terminal domain-containing protein n=1 Tax=Torulaspora globosa TaxID=48254 RepID=A0A7G3ZJQ7_9SACH|nr:uncharacterized protein HG536_0F00680 [Torulaspora globosa]QLL33743.1 hypothetical protein HG536_0F00680 [Torulaspora globosa]